jgi:hypothetical protein
MQEHRVPGIHNETTYCGSAWNHSRKVVNDGSVTAAAFMESRQQEEIMCPFLESSDPNHPFHNNSNDSVYNNIQSQQDKEFRLDKELRLKTLQGIIQRPCNIQISKITPAFSLKMQWKCPFLLNFSLQVNIL